MSCEAEHSCGDGENGLTPVMYASITMGTCSGVNAVRISVALVDRARPGLSSDKFWAKYLLSWLLKPHWAAEMKKEPPTVRQTVMACCWRCARVDLFEWLLDLQLMMAVACDKSAEPTWTWAFYRATWVVSPTAKPTMIWKPINFPLPIVSFIV